MVKKKSTEAQREQWRIEKALERQRKMASQRCLFSGCQRRCYKNKASGKTLRFCSKHRTRKSRNLPVKGSQ